MKKFLLIVLSLALVCTLAFAGTAANQNVNHNSLIPVNDTAVNLSSVLEPLVPPEPTVDPREVACVVCSPCDIPEGEPTCYDGYVDNFNMGCNYGEQGLTTPVYSPISCNTSICGTVGTYSLNGTLFRDTDWYSLTLTETTPVKWCAASEAWMQVAILDITDGCYEYITGNVTYTSCDTVCTEATLPAGTYAFFTAQSQNNQPPCGTVYRAWLTCGTPEPCFAPEVIAMDIHDALPFCSCVTVCAGQEMTLCVGPLGADERPIRYTLTPGCSIQIPDINEITPPSSCDDDCPPITPIVTQDWTYDGAGRWCMTVVSCESGCFCFCLDKVLPVELVGFDAVAGDEQVSLSWTTASEANNARFEIVRDAVVITAITANNYAAGSHYTWTDNYDLTNGREYNYSLVAVSMDDIRETIGTVSAMPTASAATITEYALHQNYPNPFNPETSITFDIVEAGKVSLTVYNPLGQTVATLVNGTVQAGRHTVAFDGANLPSGLYFYRLDVAGFSAVKKMVLMK
jgi:hypothetical protein